MAATHDNASAGPSPMDLIFLGTGVSTAIPVMGHLSKGCACHDAINTPGSRNMRNNVSILLRRGPSAEAAAAVGAPPENSLHNADWQNRRAAVETNILFDCGKTFRAAYFNVLAKLGVSVINALLLTHEHADAAAGLDDLRDLIPIRNSGDRLEVYEAVTPCPTYMTYYTLCSLARTVGYTLRYSRFLNAKRLPNLPHRHAQSPNVIADFEFCPSLLPGGGEGGRGGGGSCANVPTDEASYKALLASVPPLGPTERRVTSLDVIVLPEGVQPFYVKGLAFPVTSFPVFHGGDYICTAYTFGSGLKVRDGQPPTALQAEAHRRTGAEEAQYAASSTPTHFLEKVHRSVVFMSDVSSIGPASQRYLASLEPVDLLIVDLLLGPGERHFSHWCFDDVVEFVQVLRPRGVLGVGMFCTIEHAAMNKLLADTLASMRADDPTLRTEYMGLAHDGLSLKLE